MNSRSGKSQKIRHNYMKIYLLTGALCFITALIVGLVVVRVVKIPTASPVTTDAEKTGTEAAEPTKTNGGDQTPAPTGTAEPTEQTGDDEPTAPPVSQIERIPYSPTDFVKASPLMLVNEEHPYEGTLSGLINTYQNRTAAENPIKFANSSIEMRRDAFTAFEKLHFAVNEVYPELTLQIVSGYSDDPGTVRCTPKSDEKPCLTDEHATGYAADCWFITKNNKGESVSLHFYDPAAVEQTKYMLEKAAELGIIQSKKRLVGHTQFDERHLRYVGVPHAYYIYSNDLTLEDYLAEVRKTNFNKRLTVTVGEQAYEIYFVKAAESGDTQISVPTGSDYTVYSDNVEGYIVTIKK